MLQHINARNVTPLTNDQLHRVAPSIFAAHPWSGVSDKYTFVPTVDIIDRLRDEGLVPINARQSNTRVEGKGSFTRHEVRLVDVSLLQNGRMLVGGTYPTVNLTNSHDTGAALSIDAGLFRLACANGMMVPDGIANSVRVKHIGDLSDVIEGVFEVVAEAKALPGLIEEYSSIRMSPQAQAAFANAALELRKSNLPLTPAQILMPRRAEDRSPMDYGMPKAELWTTLNVVQESLVRGGIRTRTSTNRRTSTRAIQDIVADQKLNKALFVLAETMKTLV